MKKTRISDSEVVTGSGASLSGLVFRATLLQVDKNTGLPADSTGVKYSSAKFKFSASSVKQLVLLSSISSIPSDAVVVVGVYDETAGSYVVQRTYNGATGEYEDSVSDNLPSDGDMLSIRVEVTTASATSGSTFDLDYAVLLADYGV